MSVTGFHVRDGWFFRRLMDGSVCISHTAPGREPTLADDVLTVDDATWGSIVASVSIGGESKGRWYSAMDFHHGRSGDREGYA